MVTGIEQAEFNLQKAKESGFEILIQAAQKDLEEVKYTDVDEKQFIQDEIDALEISLELTENETEIQFIQDEIDALEISLELI